MVVDTVNNMKVSETNMVVDKVNDMEVSVPNMVVDEIYTKSNKGRRPSDAIKLSFNQEQES